MHDADVRTRQTYEDSAKSLTDYFKSLEPREDDVARAFELVHPDENGSVLELGCGDGRDASVILKRTAHYTGLDYSEGLIKAAQQTNPEYKDTFIVSDVRTYKPVDYKKYAIIFAFASLIHLDPVELKNVLEKYFDMLQTGGIIYLSMKESDQHTITTKEDRHGWRLYHLYHPDELTRMLPEAEEIYRNIQEHGGIQWFTQVFRRAG